MAEKKRIRIYPSEESFFKYENHPLTERRMRESGLASIYLNQKTLDELTKEPLFLPVPGKPQGEYEAGIADFKNKIINKTYIGDDSYCVPVRIFSSIDD